MAGKGLTDFYISDDLEHWALLASAVHGEAILTTDTDHRQELFATELYVLRNILSKGKDRIFTLRYLFRSLGITSISSPWGGYPDKILSIDKNCLLLSSLCSVIYYQKVSNFQTVQDIFTKLHIKYQSRSNK